MSSHKEKSLKNPLKQYGLWGWNYWHLIKNPWIIPGHIYRDIKWFVQRGRRGYSDQDVWNLFAYLLRWLPNAISDLEKNKYGYPIGLSHKRWHKILKDMEKGLRSALRYTELDFPPKDLKKYQKEADKGLDLFRKYFYNLWD